MSAVPPPPPGAPEVEVVSTLGVMGVLRELAPGYEKATGARIAAAFAPTTALTERIGAGGAADVAILTAAAIDELARDGILSADGRVDLARSVVGVAVRAGAPKPDIGTPGAFTRALLDARSLAYSRAGASGIFFADLIRRLGIAERVDAKATVIPSGLTGELAARGEVEVAIQQVSELMEVPGVDIVGRCRRSSTRSRSSPARCSRPRRGRGPAWRCCGSSPPPTSRRSTRARASRRYARRSR